MLPAVNGSAHVGFSDGREAIVGVKLEVEKTMERPGVQHGTDVDMVDDDEDQRRNQAKGKPEWVTLSLIMPGLRDDDPNLAFLEEMLREPLVVSAPQLEQHVSLQDSLVINSRWHWHIYIDVLLTSPNALASYPLPLLSMATYLALRDTRIPKLKSEGEEDPVADDDWMASSYLYPHKATSSPRPPVILLVVVVGDNAIFDPSREELAVADAIVAISLAGSAADDAEEDYKVLAVRMIDTPARDTMKGVPQSGEAQEGVDVPGVWRPRVGGVKRSVLKAVLKSVVVDGVARDVMNGLDGFLDLEAGAATGSNAAA